MTMCKRQSIFFRTKRGKTVRFVGRKAGSDACGGRPKAKAPTAAQKAARKLFREAAKACNGEGTWRGACIRGRLGVPGSVKKHDALVKRNKKGDAKNARVKNARVAKKLKMRATTDTSICDEFKSAQRKKLCLQNLKAGRVLVPR